MTTNQIKTAKPTARLIAEGFVPDSDSPKSVNVRTRWTHQDGRVATVRHGLAGRTSPGHSTGCGWTYTVTVT